MSSFVEIYGCIVPRCHCPCCFWEMSMNSLKSSLNWLKNLLLEKKTQRRLYVFKFIYKKSFLIMILKQSITIFEDREDGEESGVFSIVSRMKVCSKERSVSIKSNRLQLPRHYTQQQATTTILTLDLSHNSDNSIILSRNEQ